jgi:hypothetical protein
MNCEAVGMYLQAGAVLNAETSDFLFNRRSCRRITLGTYHGASASAYRKISRGKVRPACKVSSLTVICEHDSLDNMGSSTSHNPIGPHGLLQGQIYFVCVCVYMCVLYSLRVMCPLLFV